MLSIAYHSGNCVYIANMPKSSITQKIDIKEAHQKIYKDKIIQLLKEKNLTKYGLAKALKRDPVTVHRWLNGERKIPIEDVLILADFFKVRFEDIYFNKRKVVADYTVDESYILQKNLNKNLTVELERCFDHENTKVISINDIGYFNHGCVYIYYSNGIAFKDLPEQLNKFEVGVLSKLTLKISNNKYFECIGIPYLQGNIRELKILNPRLKTIPGTENLTQKNLAAAFPIVARYNPLLMK